MRGHSDCYALQRFQAVFLFRVLGCFFFTDYMRACKPYHNPNLLSLRRLRSRAIWIVYLKNRADDLKKRSIVDTVFSSYVWCVRRLENVVTSMLWLGSVRVLSGDTECLLQVCQLSRSSESTHFLSFRRDVALFDSSRGPDGL